MQYAKGRSDLLTERRQVLDRAHSTHADRQSHVYNTFTPSPGRYKEQKILSNATAFAAKAERQTFVIQLNANPSPAVYNQENPEFF